MNLVSECNPKRIHPCYFINAVKRYLERVAVKLLGVNDTSTFCYAVVISTSKNNETFVWKGFREVYRYAFIASGIFQSVLHSPLDCETTSHGSVAVRTACV
nr:MAG TPA: hypothetical protein [Caudoviricetes sp.]